MYICICTLHYVTSHYITVHDITCVAVCFATLCCVCSIHLLVHTHVIIISCVHCNVPYTYMVYEYNQFGQAASLDLGPTS